MSTNVSELRKRLQDLLVKLGKFDTDLEDNFAQLERAWRSLDERWDGVAYNEFVASWDEVRAMLRQYNDLSVRYEEFLRERIEALERFEQGSI